MIERRDLGKWVTVVQTPCGVEVRLRAPCPGWVLDAWFFCREQAMQLIARKGPQ